MKKIILSLAMAALAVSCAKVDDIYYGKVVDQSKGETPAPDDSKISWSDAADYATTKLINEFWRVPNNGFIGSKTNYHFTGGMKGAEDNDNNYWPQAHAMDVIIDAYLRAKQAGDNEKMALYKDIMDKGYKNAIGDGTTKKKEGVLWTSYGGGTRDADISACFGNPFTDDMQWHALTLLRLYEATREAIYLKEAQKLYAQIWKNWDLEIIRHVGGNGGFLWSWSVDGNDGYSKNACSNGPGCLVAIRMHEVSQNVDTYKTDSDSKYKDFDYLANAEEVYNWVSAVLYNKETGMVYSGISEKNGLHTAFTLTYDQGTFLGAAHLLYKYTNKKSYLDDAVRAALYTTTNSGITQNGILRNEGPSGDQSLFKGIFIRYVVNLINDPAVDKSTRIQLHDFVKTNAITLWTKGLARDEEGKPTGVFTPDWTKNQLEVLFNGPEYSKPNLGWQVSGTTLMESVNVLKNPRK